MIWLLPFLGIWLLPLSVFAVRSWRSRSRAPLAEAARGVAGGATAGVVWGVGARAAMRAVALAAGDPTEFTIGGRFFVLIAGAVLGALLGLILAAVRRWLPAPTIGQGLIFGWVVLVLFLVPFATFGPADLDRQGLTGIGSFGALFVVFGAALGVATGWRDQRRFPSIAARGARPPTGNRDERARLTAVGPVL